MIRVLHMIGSLNIGGSQAMIMNLYRNIDREQIQFDFILDHPEQLYFAEEVKALGGKIYFVPEFVGTNLLGVRKAWNNFFKEHPEYKILHSHVRSYASVYLPIAKKHGVKTIIHSHSTSNGTGPKALVKAALQYPLRYHADYFFSCSEEAGKWLFGSRITSGDRHFLLKNAIDASLYRRDDAVRAKYRQELGLEGKIVYAHVGRFHPAKNHAFLLNVFRRVRDARPDSILMLMGDGELRSGIEDQIHRLGLQEDVLLLGNRNDVPRLLQAADIFLFPSLWEGLGIVAVEAQAAGLPCICSDQVPRLVKVTENCRFLPLREETWVETAMDLEQNGGDTYDQIVAAGYDVHATARWLQDFYLNIWRE